MCVFFFLAKFRTYVFFVNIFKIMKFKIRKTFIHEMGHVLQDQNGINVPLRVIGENTFGGHPRGDYDWEDKFQSGTSFHKWDLEEQAQFFGDLYRAREDGTVPR